MDTADNLVFVDLETTGGNPAYDRITEVGIVRIENGECVDQWSSLVNPECAIAADIQAFNGISSEMVADAPRFKDLAATVLEKLKDAVFIAHNARFDYAFLRGEFRKVGMDYSAEALCTVKLSRRLSPRYEHHNLDALIARHGLTCDARHRALGDARVLRDLWLKLERETPAAVMAAAAAQSRLLTPALPAHMPAELADELPDGPGVYRFFGQDGALLYVGKAHSLRSRILSQLCEAHSGSRDERLAAEVRTIDWLETAGELGAMLLEAHWIRTLEPPFNRHPKEHGDSVTLRPAPDASGRVRIERIDSLEPQELAQCYGVFHAEKDARKALKDIASAHELCLKALGLEESGGSCFAFQMGKCRGACNGKEALVLHNMRSQLALSSLKIKSWPFPGRIALRERHLSRFATQASFEGEYHVLDHWTYLGTARCADELAGLAAQRAASTFDVDVYKILLRYFSNHPKLEWHDLREKTTCA